MSPNYRSKIDPNPWLVERDLSDGLGKCFDRLSALILSLNSFIRLNTFRPITLSKYQHREYNLAFIYRDTVVQ